jgi:hypothetical protein
MTDIDLTDCRHPVTDFADLTQDHRNYFASCRRCGAQMWQTPEWNKPTISDALDIYEGLVHGEAAADELNNPGSVAFQARYHLSQAMNTETGRRLVAAGVWVVVHPHTFRTILTTSADCAQTYEQNRLYVVPPHVWDDAIDRLYAVWQADLRDSGR